MRLLVVEDNSELSKLLGKGLDSAGLPADNVATAEGARQALAQMRYSAVVLDLGLPDEDGLTLLREIRGRRDTTPVLVLTARGSVPDRVTGLRSGADDYLVKPFAFEELIARLQALMRRPGEIAEEIMTIANLAYYPESRSIRVDGVPRGFPAREVAILEILLRRRGHVVPKNVVEDQLFGAARDATSNAVEVYVHRLRKELADIDAKVRIHTIRGVGYMITERK